MTTICGDILNIKSGIIVHQVNCQKAMGCGLAKGIRGRYPKHYQDYFNTEPKLGNIIVTEIIADQLYVIGMYAQDNYGTECRQTDYEAFANCLKKLKYIVDEHGDELQVFMPYKIGCGLAGGDWHIVEDLIENMLPEVVVMKKEGC